MIPLKTKEDLKMLKESGRILARILERLKGYVRPGVSTREIDLLAAKLTEENNALSAFKGYKGFPAHICTSVNEEVVHGIPGGRKIQEGDILSLDIGINYKGYFSDAAVTLPVGRVDRKIRKLIEVTEASLRQGIEQVRRDNYLTDISYAIQSYVEKHGFSVVRQFVGHGIGRSLHEVPEVPNFGPPHQGDILKEGMVFAIEPMVNMGTWECEILDNGWTAVTKDKRPSAHFEHTVAVTDKGPEVLTH